MQIRSTFLSLAVFVLLTGCETPGGCVFSLQPLVTEEDIIFDAALIGTWHDEHHFPYGETLTVEDSGETAYKVIYENDGDLSRYQAHLARHGSYLIADIYPEVESALLETFNKEAFLPVIPTHVFFRIKQDDDVLELAYIGDEWLYEKIESEEVQIPHGLADDALVLTGPTEALKELLLKYIGDEEAFSDKSTWYRLTPLMEASRNGEIETVKDLLALGADLDTQTKGGKTALMFAVVRGNVDVVETLLAEGANVNIKDNDGRTVLTYVSYGKNEEIVQLLKNSGAKE